MSEQMSRTRIGRASGAPGRSLLLNTSVPHIAGISRGACDGLDVCWRDFGPCLDNKAPRKRLSGEQLLKQFPLCQEFFVQRVQSP